jgi:ribulose bisphosphate carboxylase small subunit
VDVSHTNIDSPERLCAPLQTPTNNKFFETFSFLPPLSNDEITKQVNYIVGNGWTPCLEFAEPEQAYVSSHNSERFGPVSSGYQDNRYWTMWKLPMFGCQVRTISIEFNSSARLSPFQVTR